MPVALQVGRDSQQAGSRAQGAEDAATPGRRAVEEAAVAARRASQQRENPWEGPAAGGDAALGGMDVKDDDL